MPTIVIDNVPVSLHHRLEHLATARQQTAAATVLEMLESALRASREELTEAPLPQEPFLTEEMVAPCSIPRPVGEPVIPVDIIDYVPLPHDLPDED